MVLIRLLADYREGLKREDIAKLLNMSSGGTLSKLLEALVVSDFVTRYQYFGKSKREPTLKSKACLKCLYFTIIIFDLCRYLEYFSYLYTINQTE